MWSPRGGGRDTSGTADVAGEADGIVRALVDQGPSRRQRLHEVVGARYWGPGRFRRARHAAERQGWIRRTGRTFDVTDAGRRHIRGTTSPDHAGGPPADGQVAVRSDRPDSPDGS